MAGCAGHPIGPSPGMDPSGKQGDGYLQKGNELPGGQGGWVTLVMGFSSPVELHAQGLGSQVASEPCIGVPVKCGVLVEVPAELAEGPLRGLTRCLIYR